MTINFKQQLDEELRPIYESLIDFVASSELSVSVNAGQSENDNFPYRGFLSFTKANSENELALTVSVKTIDIGEIIKSDVCLDDGRLIADGPSAMLSNSNKVEIKSSILSDWVSKYRLFVSESKEDIIAEIRKWESD